MARVAIVKPDPVDDPISQEIFNWVTEMESAVPNNFYRDLWRTAAFGWQPQLGEPPTGDNTRGLRT